MIYVILKSHISKTNIPIKYKTPPISNQLIITSHRKNDVIISDLNRSTSNF